MREYRELMAQQRVRAVWTVVFGIIVLAMCIGAALAARTLFVPTPEPTPTTTSPISVAPMTPTTPLTPMLTNTPTPADTATPAETPAPTPTPTTAPLPEPSPTPPPDPQGDVGAYESGDPVEGVPGGVDIRTASVGADLRVVLQPTGGVPAELAEWAAEGEVLLWIYLYDPIPDPPTVFTDWVFVLDLDGDTTTGRPAGTVRVNPDLGYEVAIGVSYDDTSGKYEPYLLVWDPAKLALVSKPDEPRFILPALSEVEGNEARTLIGLALSLETLAENVEQTTGTTLVAGEVKGRAAVQSRAGGWKVVDFYPDRPD